MGESTEFADFSSVQDWFFLIASFVCVTCAALAAGLTLGILSLDTLKLQIKTECGTEDEKKAANVILPLVEDRHLLLCTLLIFNSAANEALPIFLDRLVPSYIAVLVSVTLVLICGEVLPAAFFTGPDQLIIASRFRPLVAFLIFIFYPLARPMATGLDNLLGHDEDGETMSRDELAVLMQINRHGSISKAKLNNSKSEEDDFQDETMKDRLSQYEVNTITGVLSLASKTVSDIMIPMEKVAMFSSELKLTKATFQQLDKSTHSRVIIYRGNNKSRILGYLELRKLLTVDLDEGRTLGSLELSKVMVISSSHSINDLLSHFEDENEANIVVICERPELLRESIRNDSSPPSSAVPLGILTADVVFRNVFYEKKRKVPKVTNVVKSLHTSMHPHRLSSGSSCVSYIAAASPHESCSKDANSGREESTSMNPIIAGGDIEMNHVSC